MERFVRGSVCSCCLLLIGSLNTGCHPAVSSHDPQLVVPAEDSAAAVASPAAPPALPTEVAVPAERTPKSPEEIWFACYLGDAKIGHSVTRLQSQQDQGRTLVRVELEQVISLLRNQDRITQELRLESVETPEGAVVSLRSSMSDGSSRVETEGQRQGRELRMVLRSAGKATTMTLPWEPAWRGFFAEQQILRASPPKPGDVRTFSSLIPVLNIVGQSRLQVGDWEETQTPFGKEKLLRVETVVTAPQIRLASTLWCDAAGEIRKYFVPQAKLTSHRTVRELALAENDDVDLYDAVHVRVAKPIPQPHATRRAVYLARLPKSADPRRVFVHDLSQQVRVTPTGEVEIEVIAVRPGQPAELRPAPVAPAEADLAANNLIQSDDPRILELARRIAPAEPDPWRWALACERFVAQSIERKDLSQAFATAAEVAESKAGDCTEHAVLTAALCRAHGIPARVATGLVAYRDLYAFHMWNEVWIADRWIPIDATLGLGGIGAGHVKLGVSSLDGVTPFAALAPVLEVMGTLELRIREYE